MAVPAAGVGRAIEELAIDHRRILAILREKPSKMVHHGFEDIEVQPILKELLGQLNTVYRAIDQTRRLERGEAGKGIIMILGESASQPGVGATIPLVGDEASRRVATRTQKLGQGGTRSVERSEPAGREFMRPSAREETRMGCKRPR